MTHPKSPSSLTNQQMKAFVISSATCCFTLIVLFSSFSQRESVVVGRIVHDTEVNAETKISEPTLMIEASRMHAGAARVPLRFSPTLMIRGAPKGADSVGLFPGAIVAVKGRNASGTAFLVSELMVVRLFLQFDITSFPDYLMTWVAATFDTSEGFYEPDSSTREAGKVPTFHGLRCLWTLHPRYRS
jgi:hypothetical protein